MGNCVRSILSRFRRKRTSEKTITLLVVGLDNAGKTTIVNHISGEADKTVLPTMGFRTVSLRYKSYSVKIYDIGGSSQIRSLWSKYYNDIHGLIYVVDASDISRLTENKVVFGELVAHEHVSGKPLLLLANKQDSSGAIDELDLVENLNVEQVANSMKCPTRVETCSCVYERENSKNSTMGITNGYKWLLDTIAKDYTALNERIKPPEVYENERISVVESVPNTPSKVSVHSNPFKPIKELLSKKEEENATSNSHNGANERKSRKVFMFKNKTAPSQQSIIEFEDIPQKTETATAVLEAQNSIEMATTTIVLDPTRLNVQQNESRPKLSRPYTAPGRSQRIADNATVITIPGQVLHW